MRRLSELYGGNGGSYVSLIIILAEVNLTLSLVRNISNFFSSSILIYGEFWEVIGPLLLVFMNVATTLLTVQTMFELPSSKRGAWRSTVRKLIALIVMSVLMDLFDMNYSPLNTLFITVLTIGVIIMMFLPSMRRYHTPYLTEVPPLSYWLKALVIIPDKKDFQYRFVPAEKR